MKLLIKFFFLGFSAVLLVYLAFPNPDFPAPPPDSLQSDEPADSETPFRRAYFTDSTREEVMNHYEKQLKKSPFFGIPLPTYRLNYPPEEARTIIRDQTRSTFLEEIVHPFRESLFVNGFEPKDPKDAIFISDRSWLQKITIRYVPSNTIVRLVIGLLTIVSIYLVIREYSRFFHEH